MEACIVLKKLRSMPLFVVVLLLLLTGGALLALLPERSFSELENRPLSTGESISLLSDSFAQDWEAWASDHFPGRDAWVQLDATLTMLTGRALQDGVLAVSGGVLAEEPVGQVTRTAEVSLETLEEIQSSLALPVSLVLIPTSAAVLETLPPLYEAPDQARVISDLYARTPELDALSAGVIESGLEDLYYRTDHHLTAAGARVVYESLCRHWGFTPRSSEMFRAEGFLGSYYARLPGWHIAPDVFACELPSSVTLIRDGEERSSLLDEAALAKRGKYAALIGETYAHAILTGGTGEESLLVLCDSYANAIVPLLAQHFARVDMIDPRYYVGVLADTAREAGSTRVLALFGLNTFSTNRGLALLEIGEELE